MFAGGCVEAGIGQTEPFYRFAPDDVGLNNLFHVGLGDVSVPDGVRVDHDVGTVFALIEAARLIRAHFALQAALG